MGFIDKLSSTNDDGMKELVTNSYFDLTLNETNIDLGSIGALFESDIENIIRLSDEVMDVILVFPKNVYVRIRNSENGLHLLLNSNKEIDVIDGKVVFK